MNQFQDNVYITPLTLDQEITVQAIDLLARAFRQDPLIQSLFPHDTEHRSRAFFHYLLRKSDLLNEKLLGIYNGEKLQGVACLATPQSKSNVGETVSFIIESLKFACKIPFRKFVFINSYMKATVSVRPKEPHHYLVFIGVDPQFQGQGIGHAFLEHIHQLVANDVQSTGIGLDTESPANVPLYEHFGYTTSSIKPLDPITVFCLFKSKSK